MPKSCQTELRQLLTITCKKKMEKEIIISNRIEETSRISRFIEELGVSLNVPSSVIMSIDLALEEIISHIISNAYPEEKESYIQLQVRIDPGVVTFRITDEGKAIDLDYKKSVNMGKEEEEAKELGGFLIHRTMDEVDYQTIDGQNRLTLTKRIEIVFMPGASLSTNIYKIDGITILSIEGRLDTANANEFSMAIQPLLKEEKPNIIINCGEMTYISSSGLRWFLILQKSVHKNQGTLVIEGMRPDIKHIFEMTGSAPLFNIQ